MKYIQYCRDLKGREEEKKVSVLTGENGKIGSCLYNQFSIAAASIEAYYLGITNVSIIQLCKTGC